MWGVGMTDVISSVLHQRSRTREILDGAIAEIARLRKENEQLRHQLERAFLHKLEGGGG